MKLKEMEDIGFFHTVKSEQEFDELFGNLNEVPEGAYFSRLELLDWAYIRISMIESIIPIGNLYIHIVGKEGEQRHPRYLGLHRLRTASGDVIYIVGIDREIEDINLRGR